MIYTALGDHHSDLYSSHLEIIYRVSQKVATDSPSPRVQNLGVRGLPSLRTRYPPFFSILGTLNVSKKNWGAIPER